MNRQPRRDGYDTAPLAVSPDARAALAETLCDAMCHHEGRYRECVTKADALAESPTFVELLRTERATGWDERSAAHPLYRGPDNGHALDCLGWDDCRCGTYPNPYRTVATAEPAKATGQEVE